MFGLKRVHDQPCGARAFLWVALFLAPYSLLGVDFTDTAFHHLNQKLAFTSPGFLANAAHNWLSDVLPSLLMLLPGGDSIAFSRGLGVLVWASLAALNFRLMHLLLWEMRGRDVNPAWLLWSCVPAVIVSTKPFVSGTPLIADYFSIPALAITALLLLAGKFEKTNFPRYGVGALILLLALPLFRWPLLVTSLAGLSWIAAVAIFRGKKPGLLAVLGFFSYCAFLVLYDKFFLQHYLGTSNEKHALGRLFVLYRRDLIAMAEFLLPVLGLGALAWKSWAKTWSNPRAALLARSVCSALFVLALIWSIELEPFDASTPASLLFGVCAAGFMCLVSLREWGKRNKRAALVVGTLIFLFGTHFIGSATGLGKSGYLSFLLLTPALYLLCVKLRKPALRKGLLIGSNLVALIYLYGSLYRDSLGQSLRHPAVVLDPVVGFALTSELTGSILADFQRLLREVGPPAALVGPNAPLLNAYLPQVDLRFAWPEAKAAEHLEKLLAERLTGSPDQWFFVPIRDLSHAERIVRVPQRSTTLERVWQKHCGWEVQRESEFFQVLRCSTETEAAK